MYPPSFVISLAVISGDIIHAKFVIVRYIPRVLPIVAGLPKCSINISKQSDTRVFVVIMDINDIAIRFELEEVIKMNNAVKLIDSSHIISFLLPKYLRIAELCDSNIRVTIDPIVYNKPTYFSEINFVRNVEFTYADNDMCNVNKNDRRYIRLSFVSFIRYTLRSTGITSGRFAVFW